MQGPTELDRPEQILKPAVSVSRKFLFSTKTCLCVTEVEHHIQELRQ